MKSFFTILFVLIVSLVSAQKAVVQIKDVIGDGKGKLKESMTVVNKEDGSFVLFLLGSRSTEAILYDKDYKKVSTIKGDKVLKKDVAVMGYTISNNQYQLISKGFDTGSLTSTVFDFENHKVTTKTLDLNLKKQTFIEFFNLGDKMYLLTLDKNSSNLIHYSIDDQGVATRNEIVIENTFYSSKGFEMNLKKILRNKYTSKVLPDDKTTMKQAAELLKFYLINDNHLVFTVDYSNTVVNIFDISLKTFEVREQTFFRPRPKIQEYGWKANSFLKDHYLFQIVSSKKEMIVTVTNRRDSMLVKQFGVEKDDKMDFTNSSIILAKTEDDKLIEKTSQFLRKISSDRNGIAVSSVNGNYQITLGGKQLMNGGGGVAMMNPAAGIPIASVGAFTFAFNPSFLMMDTNSVTHYTSVECVFDKSFNHLPDVEASSLMLKRRDFLSPDIKNVAETFFNIEDDYFLGMYYKEADMYVIRKF
ncbi:hypothetical protein [uncultured Dokdonia sp.]|uniref:hypothetical protein n=1 Tax=uncultured Dokdonia sp. TaxID=575653 RepID=UPI0026179115|nr:hypothetical protein [uncultured Dokdonia sp.]